MEDRYEGYNRRKALNQDVIDDLYAQGWDDLAFELERVLLWKSHKADAQREVWPIGVKA